MYVYVRGTSAPQKTSVNVKELEGAISENVRLSFELEGHKISDADWIRISDASQRLAAMI